MPRRHAQPVVFQGLAVGLKMFRWVTLLLLILFLGSGITQVQPDGVGLHLRFGRLIEPPREPGLLLALPFPVDDVLQVPTRQEGEVVVKELWQNVAGSAGTDKIDPTLEGYCLTGDQNIVQTRIVAKYRIVDPVRYRLWFVEPESLLQDVVMEAANYVVAQWRVDDVLRLQRPLPDTADLTESLAECVRARAQRRLDDLNIGLRLLAIEFNEIHPPRHVVAAFRDVQSAKIEMETAQREAEGFRASEIPKAEAARNRMIQEANALLSSAVAEAEAELSVFRDLFVEYEKNADLVRQRIYMETFEAVLQSVGQLRLVTPRTRVIVSDEQHNRVEGESN